MLSQPDKLRAGLGIVFPDRPVCSRSVIDLKNLGQRSIEKEAGPFTFGVKMNRYCLCFITDTLAFVTTFIDYSADRVRESKVCLIRLHFFSLVK